MVRCKRRASQRVERWYKRIGELAINHSEVKTNELPAAIREAALRIARTTAKDGTNDKLVAAAAAFFSTDYVEHVMAGSAHARWG